MNDDNDARDGDDLGSRWMMMQEHMLMEEESPA